MLGQFDMAILDHAKWTSIMEGLQAWVLPSCVGRAPTSRVHISAKCWDQGEGIVFNIAMDTT